MLAGVHDIELVSSHPSHHISSRRMEWWSRSGGFFLDLLIDGKCRCPVSVGPDLSVSSLSRDDMSAQIIRYCDLKGSGGKNWLLGLAVVSEGGGTVQQYKESRDMPVAKDMRSGTWSTQLLRRNLQQIGRVLEWFLNTCCTAGLGRRKKPVGVVKARACFCCKETAKKRADTWRVIHHHHHRYSPS